MQSDSKVSNSKSISESTSAPKQSAGTMLRVSLWLAQIAICGLFLSAGFMKLTMPVSEISKIFPWTGQVPELFLRSIAVIDLAGGIGILLPSATKIRPQLSILAAAGCTVLQLLAICFHASRGELAATPFNFVVVAICIFILWGRSTKAPILSRE